MKDWLKQIGLGMSACFFADDDDDKGGGAATEISEDLKAIQDDFDKKVAYEGEDEDGGKPAKEDEEIDVDDGSETESADDDKDGADAKNSGDDKTDGDEEQSAISDELVRRAERLGLDADEAKAFKSPETLERVLRSLEGPGGTQQPQGGQQPPPPKPENPFKFKLGLSKDEYDDKMVDQFESMNDHYANLVGTLYQQVSELMNRQYVEQFDGQLAAMEEGWQTVFGKGGKGDLDPKSAEYRARARLDGAIATIQSGRERLGKPPLSFKEAFQRALHSEFYKDVQKIKDGQLGKQLQTRKRQVVGRSSRHKGKPLTAYEQAVEISRDFDEKLAEEGLE